MVRLLVVDDEKTIRRGIQSVIDWTAHGISIVGDAKNGREGLEQVRRFQPDIVLADIRMPVMDGLEFIRRLKRRPPCPKIVLLSGHDEFEYAKEALRLGVEDYILKPFGAEKLLTLMLSLKAHIADERAREAAQRRREQLIREHVPVLRAELVRTLVAHGGDASTADRAALVGTSLTGPGYRVIVTGIDGLFSGPEGESAEYLEGMQQRLMDAASTVFGDAALFAFNRFHQLVGVLSGSDIGNDRIVECAAAVKRRFSAESSLSVTTGVGSVVRDLSSIPTSFGEATTAIRYRVYRGKGTVLFHRPSMATDWNDAHFEPPSEMETELVSALLNGDGSRVQSVLSGVFARLKDAVAAPGAVRTYAMRLVVLCAFVSEEAGVDGHAHLKRELPIFRRLDRAETIDEIHRELRSYALGYLEDVRHHRLSRYRSVVRLAIERVRREWNAPLSLKELAGELSVTPGYLSKAFKEDTGTSFLDYVHGHRVERAVTMLRRTTLRAYEIAEQCGYRDYKYFHSVFRKYTGTSPSNYRGRDAAPSTE